MSISWKLLIGSVFFLLLAGQAYSQSPSNRIVLEGLEGQFKECSLEDSALVQLNAVSGDLEVVLADFDSCLGGAVLDVSELVVTPNSVVAGLSFTIVWASIGPAENTVPTYACTSTVGGSNPLPGWVGTPIGLSGPTVANVAASTSTGLYDLGISCTIPGKPESTVARSAQIQILQQAIDPPPAPSLTVNGSAASITINQGDSVTVLWSSQNSTSCTALGTFPGWSGTKLPSATEAFSDTSQVSSGSYTISLRCSNSGGQSPLTSVSVAIVDPANPPPSACVDRPLLGQGSLSNWVRKTTGPNSCVWNVSAGVVDTTADCRNFGDAAGGGVVGVWDLPWPAQSATRDLTISGNGGRQFIAMAFNSGDIAASHQGRMTQEIPQFAGANAGFKLWSISKCPGDYNKALIDAEMGPGCVFRERTNLIQAFEWGGPSFESDELRCALQPNTDYYFNIIWSADQPGTAPEQIIPFEACQTMRCGMNATPAGTYVP